MSNDNIFKVTSDMLDGDGTLGNHLGEQLTAHSFIVIGRRSHYVH